MTTFKVPDEVLRRKMASGNWTKIEGYFWLYYNTRTGRPPNMRTEEWQRWKQTPWIIRQFKGTPHAPAKIWWEQDYPRRDMFTDIFAQEIRSVGWRAEFTTFYTDNPPWRNQRTSIRYVKGFLKVSGTLEYR